MDGFGLGGGACNGDVTAPYQYVDPQQIVPYWTIAQRYVLADQMFPTQGSGSFTAHQDLIAAGTMNEAHRPTASSIRRLARRGDATLRRGTMTSC